MAKKDVDLDTPFRRGEQVIATRDIRGVPRGTQGKVQIHNGLGQWDRYWIMFEDDRQVGQVDHGDVTRPWQLDEWLAREQAKAEAAQRSEAEAEAAAEQAEGDGGGSGGGIASQIPAHLLERSRAAKQRLLG